MAHLSSLRGRVCVAGRSSWGADGRAWFAVVVVVVVLSAGLVPCGAVFFEVRFWGRGVAGNVLLSEIYVLACSKHGAS